MLNSKQRAYLRSLASEMSPSVLIGKGEVSENILAEIDVNLEARELIKISILQNSDSDAKSLANEIANILNAEVAGVVGRKIIMYRRSKKKGVTHIEF